MNAEQRAMKARLMELAGTPAARAARMMRVFTDMDEGGEICIGNGVFTCEDTHEVMPAIVVTLDGEDFGFITEHARHIAAAMEELVAGHVCSGENCGMRGWPALLDAIRRAADKADEVFSRRQVLH